MIEFPKELRLYIIDNFNLKKKLKTPEKLSDLIPEKLDQQQNLLIDSESNEEQNIENTHKKFTFQPLKDAEVAFPVNQFLFYSTIEDQNCSKLVLNKSLETENILSNQKEKIIKIEKKQTSCPKNSKMLCKPFIHDDLAPYDRTGYEQRFFSKLEKSEKHQ